MRLLRAGIRPQRADRHHPGLLRQPVFRNTESRRRYHGLTVKTALEKGLYGWNIIPMSHYQVESEASGSSTEFPADGSGKIKAADGTYYYFNRQGWSNKDSELSTTTVKALPDGTYYATLQYKAADYSNNKPENNGTTLGLTVTDGNARQLGQTPAVKRSYSFANNSSNPGNNSYMVTTDWDEVGVLFNMTEDTTVTLTVVQNMRNSGRSDLAYDNLRLYRVDKAGVETPLDASGTISNSHNNAWDGWSITGGDAFKINTWSTEGLTDESNMVTPFIENWIAKGTNLADADISYTVNGLIPGIYEVSGLIRVLNEGVTDAPSGATLYANSTQTNASYNPQNEMFCIFGTKRSFFQNEMFFSTHP